MVWKAALAWGLLASVATPVAAFAQERVPNNDWIFFAQGGGVFFIQPDTVRPNSADGSREVWILGEHAKDRTVAYRKSLTLYRFYCDGTYRVLAVTNYAPSGAQSYSWDGYGQLTHIRPGALSGDLERQLCA